MMEHPPFYVRYNTDIEQFRYETFWTKEPETLEWIRSFDPKCCFYDIGANIGLYSLYAASLSEDMAIYAFEPVEETYDHFCYNRSLSELKNIKTFMMALGTAPGKGKLYVPDATPGASGSQIADAGRDVTIESVDHLIGEHKFKVPDHVKIDIDGKETGVILGMERTMPQIKSILIEVSSFTKLTITAILLGAGFTMDNRFNAFQPHSRQRRAEEGIDAENIVFTR